MGMITTRTSSDRSCGAWSDAQPVVLILEGDASLRHSLEQLISGAGWRTDIYSCAADFLARPRTPGPACLVLDDSLPDVDGLDLQRRLAREARTPLIVLGDGDVATAVRAMKAGAIDFLGKPVDGEGLLASIAVAIEQSRSALQQEIKMRVLRERCATLTRREREVMQRVVDGCLNRQVARDLDIREVTVKMHRGNMMRKMRARSLPELVNMAMQLCVA